MHYLEINLRLSIFELVLTKEGRFFYYKSCSFFVKLITTIFLIQLWHECYFQ